MRRSADIRFAVRVTLTTLVVCLVAAIQPLVALAAHGDPGGF